MTGTHRFIPITTHRLTHRTLRRYGESMASVRLTLDDFYAENEERRNSAEFEFGDSWSDAEGNEYELSWVESTGELYLMLEPEAEVGVDAFGDFWIGEGAEGLSVVVVGVIGEHDDVVTALDGWETAMVADNSLEWLAQRLAPRQK